MDFLYGSVNGLVSLAKGIAITLWLNTGWVLWLVFGVVFAMLEASYESLDD